MVRAVSSHSGVGMMLRLGVTCSIHPAITKAPARGQAICSATSVAGSRAYALTVTKFALRFGRGCWSQFCDAALTLRRGLGDVGLLGKDTCPTDKAIGSRGTWWQCLAGSLRGDGVRQYERGPSQCRDACQCLGELVSHSP